MSLSKINTKKRMANAVRFLSVDAVNAANSGHPGMPLGIADVATVLFSDFLVFNPKDPSWPNRDRFILSAGHGSALLYSLLHLTGYSAITLEELKNFRQLGSLTPGHPEANHTPGVETTTGPLGQGLANAVGMALGEALMASRFGKDIANHYTYTIVGDGCLMEGLSQEAISLAGHLKLRKLIVLFDDNGITIDGKTDLSTSEDTIKRFKSCGWATHSIDGHDYEAISAALENAKKEDKPSLISCKTIIGFGAPNKQGSNKAHGSPLGKEEREALKNSLHWAHDPFDIQDEIYNDWTSSLKRCEKIYTNWQKSIANKPHQERKDFECFLNKEPNKGLQSAIENYFIEILEKGSCKATRQDSQKSLEVLTKYIPQLIGGSADLTTSNNTKSSMQKDITSKDFSGSYINYGIREHAMGAIMNGLSLYGGFIPYGGTFLTFTDYMRPAIRLSALMGAQVIYVMTHDSIGLGEDGPTHQPIEHLASLRAIPNLYVFRPCDAVETMESWQAALSLDRSSSVLALSRQALPLSRKEPKKENLTLRGGYIISESITVQSTIALLATGSEVHLALKVQAALKDKNISAYVVSIPCFELFNKQSATYKERVLGNASVLKVSIEAGVSLGWDKYVGDKGLIISIDTFGASAPADTLFKHFGFTTEAIVKKICTQLNEK